MRAASQGVISGTKLPRIIEQKLKKSNKRTEVGYATVGQTELSLTALDSSHMANLSGH